MSAEIITTFSQLRASQIRKPVQAPEVPADDLAIARWMVEHCDFLMLQFDDTMDVAQRLQWHAKSRSAKHNLAHLSDDCVAARQMVRSARTLAAMQVSILEKSNGGDAA